MFWFNPNLFFNGNRLTFIHEYRKSGVNDKKIEGNKNTKEEQKEEQKEEHQIPFNFD